MAMEMEFPLIWTMARRELREALGNKWLGLYALGFAALALALSSASQASSGYSGLGGFGRTAASLINALLLFVPLLGLSVGAACLAGDRERGTLLYLLAQPVNRAEVFTGKALGAALAVSAATFAGFGLAGLALAANGDGEPLAFLALAGYTLLLALASLGLGLVVSALARTSGAAMSAALILWLGLAFFSDLGLVGVTLAWRPTPAMLFGLLVVNPLQAFKLGAIYSLRASLDTLGAAGQYAAHRLGDGLPWFLAALLAAWVVVTWGAALAVFSRRGDA
jgi:Cu-processing system permease protein